MKITLLQAINLRSDIEKKLRDLYSRRDSVATVTKKPEEENSAYITETVDDLTAKINEVIFDYVSVNDSILKQNMLAEIPFMGDKINIMAALRLADLMRKEANSLDRLASRNKIERSNYGASSDLVTVVTYDIESYRTSYEALKKSSNTLSSSIDTQNQLVQFDLDIADKYLG